MRHFLFLVLIFACHISSISQTEFKVHFEFPHAGEFEIRIDSGTVYKTNIFMLPEGHYFVEIWVPKTKVRTDTIYVNPDSYNLFQYRGVEVRPEIAENRRAVINYSVISAAAIASIGPTIVGTLQAIDRYNIALNIYRDIERLTKTYQTSLHLGYLESIKVNYNNLTEQYNEARIKYRNAAIFSTAMFVGNIGITYLFFKHIKRPRLFKVESPFQNTLSDISFNCTGTSIGLTLKL